MKWSLMLLLPVAAIAGLGLAGTGLASADDPVATTPPAQQVLLGAPDPAAPTERGIFVNDPEGQIEHLVATGHLVVWTVRTPADKLDEDRSHKRPITFPTASQIVVVDERGGTPLVVDFPGRLVTELRAFRGPTGAADPRIAVRSCTGRKTSTCDVEVLALTPAAPLTLVSRSSDRFSATALSGAVDAGQRLIIGKRAGKGKHKACLPRLSVHPAVGKNRLLPKLPGDPDYPTCVRLQSSFIHARYVFAEVSRGDYDNGRVAGILYGFDLEASNKNARWEALTTTYGSSEDADDGKIGPGINETGLYFNGWASDDDGGVDWLDRILLPQTFAPDFRDPVISDSIGAGSGSACAVAATDDAIYDLVNKRCSGYEPPTGAAIRRVVNPLFHPFR